MDKTVELIEKIVVPQLKEISGKLEKIFIDHERHKTELKNQKENFLTLNCRKNEEILKEHSLWLRDIENSIKNGHKQNEECQFKNKKIDSLALRIEKNEEKNMEQESRYKTTINIIWGILTIVFATGIIAFFSHYLNWKV